MSRENVESVRRQFETFERGLDAVAEFWHPEIEWRAVEEAADDVGVIRGEATLRRYYEDWIESRGHPPDLRHSYAAELAREGTPMNVLRDALGHSSLATTDRYLRDVAPTHVIETMRRREWVL